MIRIQEKGNVSTDAQGDAECLREKRRRDKRSIEQGSKQCRGMIERRWKIEWSIEEKKQIEFSKRKSSEA